LGRHARHAALRYDWNGIGDTLLAIADEVVRRGRGKAQSCARHCSPNGHRTLFNESIRGRSFLVACPRSGTTLLQSFLAAHPRMTSFPESHFFTRLVPAHLGPCTAGVAARSARRNFRKFLKKIGRPNLGRRLAGRAHLMRQYVRAFVGILDELTLERGKDHWLEKTPDHLHVIAAIEKYVPSVRFIHLLRRGEDVVASLYEVTRRYPRYWHGAWAIDACTDEWNQDVRRSMECRGRPNHYFLRYEDLVTDPAAVLSDLCRFLDLAFEPAMLEEQAAAAAAVVLPDEPWKAQTIAGLQKSMPSKFGTVFTPQQQSYVRARLINLEAVFPMRFPARTGSPARAAALPEFEAGSEIVSIEDARPVGEVVCS
jgi:hypothetical protein